MSYVLFISEQKLKDGSGLNGNIDMEYLLPYLKIAQKKYVETKLGTDLYEKLQTDITNNALTGNYKILIDDYVQEMLVHWAFYESLPFLRYKIMNNNIFQKTGETGQTLSREEAQDLREEVRNTAEFYTERLIDYFCNNNIFNINSKLVNVVMDSIVAFIPRTFANSVPTFFTGIS